MINVTKSYLPDKEKYKAYIDKIYASGWLTNNGELLKELEKRLAAYLGVKHVIAVANGSLGLQVAYKMLELTGEVITTPFSFVATASTLVWEGLKPVYADIEEDSLNLNVLNIEALINDRTSAILPVHVYGNPCNVEAIGQIAEKYNLKVIYDAAHAFSVNYKNESVLKYGDVSVLSFHATKVFHSIEGGAIVTNDDDLAQKARLLINFGIAGQEKVLLAGTNAKMNEFEAAMGLCVLDDIDDVIDKRKIVCERYLEKIGKDAFQKIDKFSSHNYAYFPVIFDSEEQLFAVQKALEKNNIYPRRYFNPSLDSLEFLSGLNSCPISKSISERVLCLPVYPDIDMEIIYQISKVVRQEFEKL